jgi:hypothetical protein
MHQHALRGVRYGLHAWARLGAHEGWGPRAVAKLFARTGSKTLFQRACEDPAVKQQTAFLKRVAGAKIPTLSLLYTELNQVPMQVHWTKVVLRFWNRLAASEGVPWASTSCGMSSSARALIMPT